jgi:hypothetical protein
MTTGTATESVLAHIGRPYDPPKVAGALLGLPPRLARQMVGAVLATSDEAEDLLDAMPRIVRSLAIATTDRAERCYGELRGPVLWSETMSARSASAGDPGLFVCATTTKAYDTDENRVLKAALAAIRRAGNDADAGHDIRRDDVLRRARYNGQRASHLIEHRTLSAVPVTKVSGRALTRTRAGSRRATYRPALELLRRAGEPLWPVHLEAFAGAATLEQLDLLAQVLAWAERTSGTSILLHVSHGSLVGGPLTYHHLAGITVAGQLVTSVADLQSIALSPSEE